MFDLGQFYFIRSPAANRASSCFHLCQHLAFFNLDVSHSAMYAVVYNWGFVWTCVVVMFIFLNCICLFIVYICFLGVQMEGRQQLRAGFLLITIKVLGIELRLSSVVASTLPAGV